MLPRRFHRPASLIALFALLWGLVFPALAQMTAGAANEAWTEVCTVRDVEKVQQQVPQDDGSMASHHASAAHCLLCCVSGLPSMMAAFHRGGLTVEALAFVFPVVDVPVPAPVALLDAPPRAPPVSVL